MATTTRRLPTAVYLAYPLRLGAAGAAMSPRRQHVREKIAQVIGTLPSERMFRPEFGAGVQRLLFDPNAPALWDLARKRLSASLAEELKGEVDPRTLSIEIDGLEAGNTLRIRIGFALAVLGERSEETFLLGPSGAPRG